MRSGKGVDRFFWQRTINAMGALPKICCFLPAAMLLLIYEAQGQYYQPKRKLATFEPHTIYTYIKPVYGILFARPRLEGDNRFTEPDRYDLIHRIIGGAIGYNLGRLELETGLVQLPIYTGYFFSSVSPDTNLRGVGAGASIDYFQFPLIVRYTFWHINKRLQVRAVTGIGFNLKPKQILPNKSFSVAQSMTTSGAFTEIRMVNIKDFRSFFVSGELGIQVHYQLHRRISVGIDIERLVSARNVGNLNAEVQQDADPTIYKVQAMGGANGVKLGVSLAYIFTSTN